MDFDRGGTPIRAVAAQTQPQQTQPIQMQQPMMPQQYQQPMVNFTQYPQFPTTSSIVARVDKVLDDVDTDEHVSNENNQNDHINIKKQESKKKKKKKNTNSFSFFPTFLVEPLIIFILYILLSLDIVKSMIIPYIGSDGSGIFGVVVYGLILSLLFMVVKKIVV